MRADIRRRIERLEAKLGKSDANEVNTKRWGFWSALMAIVAVHGGKLSGGESQATAFARALDMRNDELKRALSPGYDGPNLSRLTLEKLNSLVAARGGRPIAENGELILETPKYDDRHDGFEVLDELYQEIPDQLKKRFKLLPSLAYYFKEATGGDEDNRAQR